MKFLSTLFVLLALSSSSLLLASADDSGDERNPDGSRFQFAGAGGELRLRNNATTIKMRFNRIVEIDSIGRPVATTRQRLEDVSYSFNRPVNTTYPGTSVPVLTTGFTASLKVTGASSGGDSTGLSIVGTTTFSVQVYRFNADAVIANGNGNTVSVNANDIKFSVVLSSWPFASLSNRLRLSFKTEVEGSDNDAVRNNQDRVFRKKGDGKNEISVPFPRGRLDLSLVATVDGVNQPVTVAGFRDDGEGCVAIIMPSFNSSLIYDPSLSSQDASATPAGPSAIPSISAAAGSSASLATILLAIVAIFAALF